MDWLRRIWKMQDVAAPIHPAVRVAVAVVMTALTMDMLMGAEQTPLLAVVAVADWLAAFVYVIMPVMGSATALALWVAGLMLPMMGDHARSTTGAWPLLAIVLLGMAWALLLGMRHWRYASALVCADAIAVLWFGLRFGRIGGTEVGAVQSVQMAVAVAGSLAFAVYLGRMIEGHRVRMMTRRSRMLRRRVGKATAPLHDVACNDLCYALQRLDAIRPKVSGEDAHALAEVRDVLEESLQTTRASMTALHGIGERSSDGGAGGNAVNDADDGATSSDCACADRAATTAEPSWRRLDIAKLVQRHERKLEALGFRGVGLVNADCATLAMDAEAAAVVTGLINELFGNVLKYADSSRGYSFTCGMDGSQLCVELCDAPGGSAEPVMVRSTGAGLAHYARELRLRGGDLMLCDDGGIWSVVARVPLGPHATDDCDATGSNRDLYYAALAIWAALISLMFGVLPLIPAENALAATVLLMYVAGPVASVVFGMLGVLRSWRTAGLLLLIAIVGSALGGIAMAVGDWNWAQPDPHAWWALRASALYGCAMGAVPALLGIGIGAVVRWVMRMVRAARWTVGGRRRMAIMAAAVAWSVFVVAVILIVALAIPASATPLPWTYPVLPATLMLACGCTALVPMAARDH